MENTENYTGVDLGDFMPEPVEAERESNYEMIQIKPEDFKIGAKIKKLRINLSMKPADLAAAIGKSQSYINTLESDKNDPYVQTLASIAQALDTSIYNLVLDKDYDVEPHSETLGQFLMKERKDNGMKSIDVAKHLEVSGSLITKMEKTSNLTIRTLLKYATLFHISDVELLSYVTPENKEPEKTETSSDSVPVKKTAEEKEAEYDRLTAIKDIILTDHEKYILQKYRILEDNIRAIVDNILSNA